MMRRMQVFLFAVSVTSTLAAFGISHTAYAGVYRSPYNSIETQRLAKCGTSGISRYGAVWINDIPTTNTTFSRWNENITVPWDATVVDETMWTTAVNCADGSAFSNARIINLTAGVPTSTISISFPYGTSIVRGTGTTYPKQWTNPPGALRVRINITGVGAPGTKTCFNNAISYIGTYQDSDGTGFSTNYFTDICITRQAQPWTTSSSLGIVKLDAAGTVTGGPYYSDISNATAGSIYGFRYSLRNDGPGSTTSNIVTQRAYTYPTTSQPWTTLNTYLAGRPAGTYLVQNSQVGYTGSIPASAGGKSYCLQMRSTPTSLTNSLPLYTPQRCVFVPYDYNLLPTASASPDTVPAGGTTTYSYTVTNNGQTYSEPMTYRIMQFVMPPGVALDDGGLPFRDNQLTNCPAWSNGVCATTLYTSGTTTFMPSAPYTLPVPAAATDLTAAQTSALAPGTRVCRLVALAKGTPTVVQRWSRPKCVTVGKHPFISIFNGDGWAGGNFLAKDNGSDGEACSASGSQLGGFQGATTTYSDGNDYGSFGEYQLFALGIIGNFGSGGRALSAGGVPGAATTMSYKATGQYYSSIAGPAMTSHCMDDALPYYSAIPATASLAGTVDMSSFPASGVYSRSGDLTINAMTIPAGRHITIIASGKVTIAGNIVLANPAGPTYYTKLSDIPSFTLITSGIAPTSYIAVGQSVTQLDGIYQTYNNFVTCAESEVGPVWLAANVCQQQLVVNGSVSANKLVLRRIRGGDPDVVGRNTPAEIFNMRSDIFLSAYGASQIGGQIRTVSEQELPPRY
jgi:hypothetical protein